MCVGSGPAATCASKFTTNARSFGFSFRTEILFGVTRASYSFFDGMRGPVAIQTGHGTGAIVPKEGRGSFVGGG